MLVALAWHAPAKALVINSTPVSEALAAHVPANTLLARNNPVLVATAAQVPAIEIETDPDLNATPVAVHAPVAWVKVALLVVLVAATILYSEELPVDALIKPVHVASLAVTEFATPHNPNKMSFALVVV